MEDKTFSVEVLDGKREAVAKLRTKSGVLVKPISVSDLILALSREMEMSTGVLPCGTRFFSGTKQAYTIGVQVPSGTRAAQFDIGDGGLKLMTIPFPELLFVFKVDNDRLDTTESSLFACLPPIGRPQDPLYFFPFGNVWENGGICWGDVHIPTIDELVVLDSVVAKFLSSIFSGHLVHGTAMFVPPDPEVVNLRTLLEHLQGKQFFPDGTLKQSNVTLGAAMLRRRDRHDW